MNFSQLFVRPREHLSNFRVSTGFPSTSARHRPALSGGPPNPSRPSGRNSRPFPALTTPPSSPEGPLTPTGPPGGPCDPSWSQCGTPNSSHPCWEGFQPPRPSGWASRPLSNLQEGLPTPLGPPGGIPDPSWFSGMTSRPHPALLVDLPILLALLGVLLTSSAFRMGLPTPPVSLPAPSSLPGEPPNPSWPPGRAYRLLPALQKRLLTPPGTPGGTRDPSHPSPPLPSLWEGLLTSRGPSGWLPDPSQTFGRVSHFLPTHPTPPGSPGGPPNLSKFS